MFTQRMTLGTKLAMGFGMILALSIVTGMFGMAQFQTINDHLERSVRHQQRIVSLTNGMIKQIDACAFAIRNMALSRDAVYIEREKKKADGAFTRYEAVMAELSKAMATGNGRQLLEELHAMAGQLRTLNEMAYEMTVGNEGEKIGRFIGQEIEPVQAKINAKAEAVIRFQEDLLAASGREAAGTYKWNVYLVGLISAGILLISVVVAVYIARSVTRPVNRIVEELSTEAEEMAAAAERSSSLGHALSEGAREQAAAIEEASSSLEELLAMTTS